MALTFGESDYSVLRDIKSGLPGMDRAIESGKVKRVKLDGELQISEETLNSVPSSNEMSLE